MRFNNRSKVPSHMLLDRMHLLELVFKMKKKKEWMMMSHSLNMVDQLVQKAELLKNKEGA